MSMSSFAFLVACFLGPATVPDDTARIEAPRSIEALQRNGLRIVVCPRAGEPAVALRLCLRAGFGFENGQDQKGAAALVAWTLRSALAGLEAEGGKVSVAVDLEHADLALLVPKASFEKTAKQLADAVIGCAFKDEDIARGKKALAEDRANVAGGDAVAVATALAEELAFSRVVAMRAPTRQAASAVSNDAVRAFAKSFVRPSNAVLVVAGDVDPGDAQNRLREVFAAWPRQPQPAVDLPLEPDATATRRGTAEVEHGAGLAYLFRTPDKDHADAAAVAVFAEMLARRMGARSGDSAVVTRTSTIGGAYTLATQKTEFDAVASRKEFEDGLTNFVASLGGEGASLPAELSAARESARSVVLGRIAADLSTVDRLAARFAHDLSDLDDWRGVEREFAAISKVSDLDLRRVAKRYFDPSRAAIGATGPVQRGAFATISGVEQKDLPRGVTILVDPDPGTNFVSVALRADVSAARASEPRVANTLVAEVLRRSALLAGAIEATATHHEVSRVEIEFSALATNIDRILDRTLGVLRGEAVDPKVIEEADGAAAELRRGRFDENARIVLTAMGMTEEAVVVPAAVGLDRARALLERLKDRGDSSLRIAARGDITLAAIEKHFGSAVSESSQPLVGSAGGAASGSPQPSRRRGDSKTDKAILARVFPIDGESLLARSLRGLPRASVFVDPASIAGGGSNQDLLNHVTIDVIETKAWLAPNKTYLVIALRVAPKDVSEGDAVLDATLDALAKRGILAEDISRGRKIAQSEEYELALRTGHRTLQLLDHGGSPRKDDAADPARSTQELRALVSGEAIRVLLLPKDVPTPESYSALDDPRPKLGIVTAPVGIVAPAHSDVNPCDLSLPELETRFGKNLLEPDPARPNGLGPPKGTKEVARLRRWFGGPPGGGLSGIINTDANVTDSLCEYVALALVTRHKNDPQKWAPAIIDYASWSDDKHTVTFRMKPGVHWQFPAVDAKDPKYQWIVDLFAVPKKRPELTTADLAFTFKVMTHPDAFSSGLRDAYAGAHFEVLDRYTARMTWDEPTIFTFVYSLNFQTILPEFLFSRDESGAIVPDALLGKAMNEHWYNSRLCGYGPYEFVRMDPGQSIVLRRMDDFPIFKPAVKEIEWQICGGEAATQRLLKGDLDCSTLSPLEYKTLYRDAKEKEGVRAERFATKPYTKAEYFYVGWNCRLPMFADKRVRHALAQAIDRKALVDSVYYGAAPLVEGPLYADHPFFDASLPPVKFDLEAASRELDAAGWKDSDNDGILDKKFGDTKVDFRFTFSSFSNAPEADAFCALLKDDLKKIGIEVKIAVMPFKQLQESTRNHTAQAWYGIWGTSYELDFGKFESQNAEEGSNYGGYSNPELDALSKAYEHAFDLSQRKEIARKIQAILRDDPPYAFLIRRERLTVFPSRLGGVDYSPVRPQLLCLSWYEKN